MATLERLLIVNADDFGLSAGVNRGVIESHERGIVTSASLMVRWPAAREAAEYAQAHPRLSVGLHLDLGEMEYTGEEWRSIYEVIPGEAEPDAVRSELQRQLTVFRELVGCGPTHLDSHQHRHRTDPVRSACLAVCEELRIPLREVLGGVQYCGRFYGQGSRGDRWPEAISVDGLVETLDSISPGVTELACHPAADCDFASSYQKEREIERATLCDPRIASHLRAHGIRLISFREVSGV